VPLPDELPPGPPDPPGREPEGERLLVGLEVDGEPVPVTDWTRRVTGFDGPDPDPDPVEVDPPPPTETDGV